MRRALEEMQRLVAHYKAEQAEFEKEIEAIRSGHQQELEQYQTQLQEMMEESNQMQEEREQLERRYQELYHSFQDTVEEEAHKMVSEAASTLVLSPQHTPALLQDVVKTLESQLKQDGDKHVAEALYYLRETQHKAEQLEKTLEEEHMQIAEERQRLIQLQYSVREQAKLRYATLAAHLRARWIVRSGFITTILLLILLILQMFCLYIKLPDTWAIIGPIFFCIGLGFLIARFYSSVIHFHASAPRKQKAATKESPPK